MLAAWTDAWEAFEVEIVEATEPDPRHVLAEIHQRAVGAGSGIAVEMTVYWLVEFADGADGSVTRLHMCPDRATALAAIG